MDSVRSIRMRMLKLYAVLLNRKFKHLEIVNQTYSEHLRDALTYSFISFKCSIFFILHGLYPDSFVSTSTMINTLHHRIQDKYAAVVK